jgi:hypothetical protein
MPLAGFAVSFSDRSSSTVRHSYIYFYIYEFYILRVNIEKEFAAVYFFAASKSSTDARSNSATLHA